MHRIGLRAISMLLLATGMVVLGTLGMAGIVTPGPVLAAGLLLTAIVVAFNLGRASTSLW